MTNPPNTHTTDASQGATAADIRRWRRYLANERAEAAVYRDLAGRRTGEEREILLALAEAEARHEEHWLTLLDCVKSYWPRRDGPSWPRLARASGSDGAGRV